MKKKIRSIRELLVILLDNEELFHKEVCSGLCALIEELRYNDIIICDEVYLLDDYIEYNRPKRGQHFDESKKMRSWYWDMYLWEPREAWLRDKIRRMKL